MCVYIYIYISIYNFKDPIFHLLLQVQIVNPGNLLNRHYLISNHFLAFPILNSSQKVHTQHTYPQAILLIPLHTIPQFNQYLELSTQTSYHLYLVH